MTSLPMNQQIARLDSDLAVFSRIMQAMSSSYSLSETLEIALGQVLSVIGSDVGWICLTGEDGTCWSFVGEKGLCWSENGGTASLCLRGCICHRVQKNGEVVFVDRLHPGCPLKQIGNETGETLIGHVSMPLTAHSRVVGQLNIAYSNKATVGKIDLDLLKTISSQLGILIENARLWEEVRRKENMRAELLKKVVIAQEEERRRISRELHDEMGQMLTSLLIGLKMIDRMSSCDEAHTMTSGLKGTVSQMLETIHDIAYELRPTVLDDLGLVPALHNYIKDCEACYQLPVEFATVGMEGRRLNPEIETTLYRIVQESLTNVARHAQATRASVLLEMRKETVVAIIEDNGNGFDLDEVVYERDERDRLGLYSMEERANLVGGHLTLESTPGVGTTIYVEVPVIS